MVRVQDYHFSTNSVAILYISKGSMGPFSIGEGYEKLKTGMNRSLGHRRTLQIQWGIGLAFLYLPLAL